MEETSFLFLGDSGVGKTVLLKKWLEHQFHKEYEPTIGVKIYSKASMIFRDFSGSTLFKRERKWYYPEEGIVLFIIDLTRHETIEIDEWIQEVDENIEEVYPILIGNKADLKAKREITSSELKKLASKIGKKFNHTCPYVEISTKKCDMRQFFSRIAGKQPLLNSFSI